MRENTDIRSGLFDNGIERLLTADEVALFLNIGRSTFYREVKAGSIDIPFVSIGGVKRFRFGSVESWLIKNEKRMTPKRRKNRKWQ